MRLKVLHLALMPIFGWLFACSGEANKGAIIAQVGERMLYEEDLKTISWTRSDSAEIVGAFIEDWVAGEVLLQAAEKDNNIDGETIDRKVEEFRRDLYTHQYLKARVEAEVDTVVSNEEIQDYYEAHKGDFQLNDYLVKVLYLKVPLDAHDIDKIGSAYKLQRENDQETIETFAKMYASNFYYDVDNWIYFDDILKEIPLQDINKDRFILKRSKIRFEENGFYYFLNIIDYKLKNSISPLNFERNNIKTRILNMRMRDMREKIEHEIIQSAYNNGEVQIP
ncbi:MAG: hypothetical protein ACPG21_03030 [Crocinitomicaceae bacterium]